MDEARHKQMLAEAFTDQTIGFYEPMKGSQLSIGELREIGGRIPVLIADHPEHYGEPNQRCLVLLSEYVQSSRDPIFTQLLANKICMCLFYHITAAIHGHDDSWWEQALADY